MNDTMQSRRTIRYIDRSVQKWMLIGLVAMELLLTAGLLWILYLDLIQVIDENLYRIHQTDRESIFPLLMAEGAKILGYAFAVNVVALTLADRIWAFYVNTVVSRLSNLMQKSRNLDWRENDIGATHPVLVIALAWRFAERFRSSELREAVSRLPDRYPDTVEERQVALDSINQVKGLLP